MDLTKSRKGTGEATAEQNRSQTRNRISISKFLEVAFWGTIFWGIMRMGLHFFHFTPYGLSTFARPFMGITGEKTFAGAAMGAVVLFVCSLLASFLYMLLFSRSRIWWNGLLYGVLLLLAVGFFFRIGKWEISTLSTEAAWFLSYGLFIGMTLSLEQADH